MDLRENRHVGGTVAVNEPVPTLAYTWSLARARLLALTHLRSHSYSLAPHSLLPPAVRRKNLGLKDLLF